MRAVNYGTLVGHANTVTCESEIERPCVCWRISYWRPRTRLELVQVPSCNKQGTVTIQRSIPRQLCGLQDQAPKRNWASGTRQPPQNSSEPKLPYFFHVPTHEKTTNTECQTPTFSKLDTDVKLQLSRMSCVECWNLYDVEGGRLLPAQNAASKNVQLKHECTQI